MKPVAVAAAIIRRRGRIFIARRSSGNLHGKWEFPGGKIEEGETPEECLVRELREELGISVVVGKRLTEVTYRYKSGAVHLVVFLVKQVGGRIEPKEHEAIAWVAPEDFAFYDLAPADEPVARLIAEKAANRVRRRKTRDL